MLCTADAKHCTSNLEVRYECVLSDHHPVLGNIDMNIITACHADNGRDVIPRIKWDKLPVNAVQEYELKTKVGFDGINIPDGVKCINPNCRLPSHANDLNTFYDCITTVLIESSAGLENACGASSTYNVPGWNDHVKNLHAAARDAYLLWKLGGRARQGALYDLMRSLVCYLNMLCGSVNATKTQSLLIILQNFFAKKMTRLSGEA